VIAVTRKTSSMCTDEINVQFLKDASDAVMTTAAELLVMEADRVENDLTYDLEERISRLDCLVDRAQVLLIKDGFDYAWGDDSYTISRAGN
jgi:hypothetical protein